MKNRKHGPVNVPTIETQDVPVPVTQENVASVETSPVEASPVTIEPETVPEASPVTIEPTSNVATEAPPEAPTPTVAPVVTFPSVRAVADTIANVTLAVLRAACAALKASAGKWWYVHAVDTQFGVGGTRYTHRVAQVAGRGDVLPDGTVPYASLVLFGVTLDDTGNVIPSLSRAWHEDRKNPANAISVRLNVRDMVAGLPSTAGNGGASLQCAVTAGVTMTLHANGGAMPPSLVIPGRGGRYMLSAIVDEEWRPVTA